LFFLCVSASYSNYLKFDEFISLINIAQKRSDVINNLELKGFEIIDFNYLWWDSGNTDDETYYYVEFQHIILDDEYQVGVTCDTETEQCYLFESSDKKERFIYFKSELSKSKIKLTEKSDDGEGNEEYTYKTDKYEMIISRYIDLAGTQKYSFSVSTFLK